MHACVRTRAGVYACVCSRDFGSDTYMVYYIVATKSAITESLKTPWLIIYSISCVVTVVHFDLCEHSLMRTCARVHGRTRVYAHAHTRTCTQTLAHVRSRTHTAGWDGLNAYGSDMTVVTVQCE